MMYKYIKQDCLHKDWSNVKEITAEELAYCIHKYGVDLGTVPEGKLGKYDIHLSMVPESRLKKVSEELEKLQLQEQLQKQQEKERKHIETVLAGSGLNSDLFRTPLEAEFAVNELSSCWNQEMIKTEAYDHTYKDNNHSRDVKRLQESFKKARQQYVALGGIGAVFDKLEASLPKPNKGTLKQDIDDKRESITRDFIIIGVSPTRSKKIAIAITTQLHMAL